MALFRKPNQDQIVSYLERLTDDLLREALKGLTPKELATVAANKRIHAVLIGIVNEFADEKEAKEKFADPENKSFVTYACIAKGSPIAKQLAGLNNSEVFQNILKNPNCAYALGRGYITADDVRFCFADREKTVGRLDMLELLLTEQAREFIIKGYVPVHAALAVGDSELFEQVFSNSAKKGFEQGAFTFQDFINICPALLRTQLPIVNCFERIVRKDCRALFVAGHLNFAQVGQCQNEIVLENLIAQAKVNFERAAAQVQQQAAPQEGRGADALLRIRR